MDPRCAPERVRDTDLSNELANLQWGFRPTIEGPGPPTPISSKACAVPADHGLRLDDCQSVQHPRSQTIQPGKHQAVDVPESRSLRRFAPQHVELVT
jgi:hypothetical protein